VGGQQPSKGFWGGVIDQPPGHRRDDQVGGFGGSGDRFGLPLLLLVDGGLAGGGLGGRGGLVGDAPQGGGLGDRGQCGGGLLALELRDGLGEGGEDAALAGPGVHAHSHEQTQRLAPAGSGLDLDGPGGDGGEHGEGEHAGQVGWGLGGGGDGGHILPEPAGQDLNREYRHIRGHAERDGCRPAVSKAAGGVGQLARQVRQDGRVGVGVGEADAQVDDPPAPGRLGDQLSVAAGVGDGGHGRNEGMEKRAAADVG
jgi:hypothetical protein